MLDMRAAHYEPEIALLSPIGILNCHSVCLYDSWFPRPRLPGVLMQRPPLRRPAPRITRFLMPTARSVPLLSMCLVAM
jgi:hypothetical protein